MFIRTILCGPARHRIGVKLTFCQSLQILLFPCDILSIGSPDPIQRPTLWTKIQARAGRHHGGHTARRQEVGCVALANRCGWLENHPGAVFQIPSSLRSLLKNRAGMVLSRERWPQEQRLCSAPQKKTRSGFLFELCDETARDLVRSLSVSDARAPEDLTVLAKGATSRHPTGLLIRPHRVARGHLERSDLVHE